MIKCGIIGAGAWGTAISILIEKGEIKIWTRNKSIIKSINHKNKNSYLKNIFLPKNIRATNSFKEISDCEYFFIATPAQFTRSIIKKLKKFNINKNFIICSKGIEIKSGKLLSKVIEETFPNSNIAILSGPCFADEVAKKLPTAVTLSCKKTKYFRQVEKIISKEYFRTYHTTDLIGCQIGGSVKNVYAIGAGIVNGLKLGENARSAYISRSFAELLRLGKKMGAKEKTFFGLSGLGDLILTCNSKKSRNVQFGELIVKNQMKNINSILKNKKTITEGYYTTSALFKISKKYKIDMPILKILYKILYKKTNIQKEIKKILSRPSKKEFY